MTYLDGYDPTVRLICVLVFVIVILAAVLLVYIYKDRQNRREVERLKKENARLSRVSKRISRKKVNRV